MVVRLVTITPNAETLILIDPVDRDLLKAYAWRVVTQSAGKSRVTKNPTKRDGHRYLHRMIMEAHLQRPLQPGECIDHINGNPLDNRRENLRVATHRQNLRNQQVQTRRKSSKYKGVVWDISIRMWRATVKVNGKRVYAGCSKDEATAAAFYNKAAFKYFGEFANLNEIVE